MALFGKNTKDVVPFQDVDPRLLPDVDLTPPTPTSDATSEPERPKSDAKASKPVKVKAEKRAKKPRGPQSKLNLDVNGGAPKRNRHRASYPTPGFKLFALLLNILSLPLTLIFLRGDLIFSNLIFLLLSVIGINLAIYINVMRPLPTNVELRKVASGLSAAYGFLLIVTTCAAFLL